MSRIRASTPRLSTRRYALLVLLALLGPTLSAPLAPGPAFADPDDATHAWQLGWSTSDPGPALPDVFTAPWSAPRSADPGLFVALDPVTRLPVRPSAEQRRAAATAFGDAHGAAGRIDAPLPTQRLRAGGELLHLPEGFQVFLTARRNADGRFTVECTTDPAHGATASEPTATPLVQPVRPLREER